MNIQCETGSALQNLVKHNENVEQNQRPFATAINVSTALYATMKRNSVHFFPKHTRGNTCYSRCTMEGDWRGGSKQV